MKKLILIFTAALAFQLSNGQTLVKRDSIYPAVDSAMIQQKKQNPIVLISGSVFAGAVFVGSVLLYSTNELGGIIGMLSSVAIMGIAGFFRKF